MAGGDDDRAAARLPSRARLRARPCERTRCGGENLNRAVDPRRTVDDEPFLGVDVRISNDEVPHHDRRPDHLRERLWRVGEIRQREEFVGLDWIMGKILTAKRQLTVDRGATKVQERATLFKNFPVVAPHRRYPRSTAPCARPRQSRRRCIEESPIATIFSPRRTARSGNPSSAETSWVKARPASSRSKNGVEACRSRCCSPHREP
jgi:hypothetical protein